MNRLRNRFSIVVILVFIAAACGAGDPVTDVTTSSSSTSDAGDSTTTTEGPTTDQSTTETTSVEATTSTVAADEVGGPYRAYFLTGEFLSPTAVGTSGDQRPLEGAVAEALQALVRGLSDDARELGMSTSIPSATELLGVTVDNVAREVLVDLDATFETGGGSLSTMTRIAQVVFTATQFDAIDGVRFAIDGQPVEVLTSEGLVVEGPQRRSDWDDFAPSILIESPLPFEAVSLPFEVVGTADLDGVFDLVVADGDGLIVVERPVDVDGNAPGGFRTVVDLEDPTPGIGAVIAFVTDSDGSQLHLVEVPIRLG